MLWINLPMSVEAPPKSVIYIVSFFLFFRSSTSDAEMGYYSYSSDTVPLEGELMLALAIF